MSPEAILEHLFKISQDISELKGSVSAQLEAILIEAKRTNGRVTSLEKTNENLAHLVSRHSGEFERKSEEFKLLREFVEGTRNTLNTELKGELRDWEGRRDQAYKNWSDKAWSLFKWALMILGGAILAKLGIDLTGIPLISA